MNKSTPSAKMSALSMLVRQNGLSHNESVQFLECILEEINPHINKFTLPKLGDLGCISSEEDAIQYHTIFDDKPFVEDGLSIDTHGISYFNDSGRCSKIGESRTQIAWALTKSLEWVIMEVSIKLILSTRRDGMTREKALGTKITRVSLEEMLERANVTPFSVWRSIKMEIDKWKSRQENQYNRVCQIAGQFDDYDIILMHLAVARSKKST